MRVIRLVPVPENQKINKDQYKCLAGCGIVVLFIATIVLSTLLFL